MKAFISYKFTGEDFDKTEATMSQLVDAFAKKGIEAYCSIFDEKFFKDNNYVSKQIMGHAFRQIDAADFLFVFKKADGNSEGMAIETGYAMCKGLPVIAATQNELKESYIVRVSTTKIVWNDLDDLLNQIKNFNFNLISNKA